MVATDDVVPLLVLLLPEADGALLLPLPPVLPPPLPPDVLACEDEQAASTVIAEITAAAARNRRDLWRLAVGPDDIPFPF
jgi:hypothetical protein